VALKLSVQTNISPPSIPENTNDGIAGLDGSGSGDWAHWIKGRSGKTPSVFTWQEMRIDVDRVLNQAGLTQLELKAINVALSNKEITAYAREQGIKADSLRAAQNRAVPKLRKALKIK